MQMKRIKIIRVACVRIVLYSSCPLTLPKIFWQIVAIKKFVETDEDPAIRKIAFREIRMLRVRALFTVFASLLLSTCLAA